VHEASPADVAAVLTSLATTARNDGAANTTASADKSLDAEWVAQYTAAARSKLPAADAQSLAALCSAAAALGAAPSREWLGAAASAVRALLGSGFADAGRIKNVPGWRRPFDLPQLVDAVWGLAKMGARGQEVRGVVGVGGKGWLLWGFAEA